MFDWHGYAELADDLLSLRPNDEATQRSGLSRADYGAFGVARDCLQAKRGVAIASFNAHYHVWATSARVPGGVEQRIAQEGNRLKRRRDLADYDSIYPNLATDATRWVARARRLLSNIDGLTRPEPTPLAIARPPDVRYSQQTSGNSQQEHSVADQQTTDKGKLTRPERSYGRSKLPKAPGAVQSPQMPGQVPDRSTVPGHFSTRVARPTGPVRRPLTQDGSAQEILHVFPAPDEEAEKAEFEQATASVEELRKAYPWQLPPGGPTPVFALDQGVSPEPPALPAAQPTPELDTGETRP